MGGKFPIQLHNSWPLGASKDDLTSSWKWALDPAVYARPQTLVSFTGTTNCSYPWSNGITGGLVDMTGTIGGPACTGHTPVNRSLHAIPNPVPGSNEHWYPNPGEIATYTKSNVEAPGNQTFRYKAVAGTQGCAVPSYGFAFV